MPSAAPASGTTSSTSYMRAIRATAISAGRRRTWSISANGITRSDYDGSYKNCDAWGEKRWSTAGAVVGGELVTTRLSELNCGIEEFVDRAFYDSWRAAAIRPIRSAMRSVPTIPGTRRSTVTPTSKAPTAGRRRLPGSAARSKSAPMRDFIYPRWRGRCRRARSWNRPAAASLSRAWNGTCPMCGTRSSAIARGAYAIAFNLAAVQECHARAKALIARGETRMRAPFDLPSEGRRFGGRLRRRRPRHARALGRARRRRARQLPDIDPVAHQRGPRAPWGSPAL